MTSRGSQDGVEAQAGPLGQWGDEQRLAALVEALATAQAGCQGVKSCPRFSHGLGRRRCVCPSYTGDT